FRRPAPDAGAWHCHPARAAPDPARRTVDGPGALPGRGGLPSHRGNARPVRHGGDRGRPECQPPARAMRPHGGAEGGSGRVRRLCGWPRRGSLAVEPVLMEARIRQIDVRLARFPLAEPFSSSVVRVDAVYLALVELHGPDESGIAYGFGFSRSDAALIAAAVRELAEFAIGHDLFATGALWQRMHAALAFSGRGGAGLAALSVIDMAAWDARARHLGLPLAKLIGSARDAVPAYGSSGSLSLSPQALAEEMAGFARAGYSRMKLKLGPSLRENRLRLRAVRDAVGEDAELYVDGNQQWG